MLFDRETVFLMRDWMTTIVDNLPGVTLSDLPEESQGVYIVSVKGLFRVVYHMVSKKIFVTWYLYPGSYENICTTYIFATCPVECALNTQYCESKEHAKFLWEIWGM